MGRILLLLIAGCGRIAFDPIVDARDDGVTTDGTTGGMTDGMTDGMTGTTDGTTGGITDAAVACDTNPQCPGITIPLFVGSTTADIPPGNYGFSGSCGGTTTNEAVVGLRPVTGGTFTLSVTAGAPAIIVLRDRCCTGIELACQLDTVTFTRAANETVYVSIEASSTDDISISVDGI